MRSQTELTTSDGNAIARTDSNGHVDMSRLFEATIEKLSGPGAEQAVAVMERLVDLQLKVNEKDAERAFNQAFAMMQAKLPAIAKTKRVLTRDGGLMYTYAPLDQIDKAITPHLQAHGFAKFFTDVDPKRDPKNVRTRCTLTHIDGHSIYAEAEAPPDNKNTTVSDMHKSGGASTFTARYALIRVLGLVTTDDNDGHLPPDATEPITDQQRMSLEALITETGTDLEKFLRHYQIDTIDDLPASRYQEAMAALERKRGRK